MNEPVLELVDPGLGVSYQDFGRHGWKRFGVPPGGAMDDFAARWANRLLGNPADAPVLEILFHGTSFRAMRRVELAVTGAATGRGRSPGWQAWILEAGDYLSMAPARAGVWSYVAIRSGFAAASWFGSVSTYSRGGLGEMLGAGSLLRPRVSSPTGYAWPSSVGCRWVDPSEQRDYSQPPDLLAWRGPQHDLFPKAAIDSFFGRSWQISARSDRTGYRLEGEPLPPASADIASEPVLPGSIQVPPDGIPIVTMRDGPTVGGYPKLGLVDAPQLSWLAQCRPGQEVRFLPAEAGGSTTAAHGDAVSAA